ncbi:MAG TPA: alpha/beta fold hydrolase [Nitrososphaeraceae archaeon]|nr:alpha/beta fold hydrolase [Nitrososphaeraceae archaeon]
MFSFSILSNSTFNNHSTTAIAQPFIETVKHRDLVIDLGNGIQTNAQLTTPAVGNGPFPGVLLVPGSGAVDMNETVAPDAKPFWQISQYLSERGFAVLRYDKRGVGANSQIIDTNVWGNLTFDDLKNDAEIALGVLTQQPEVDPSRITLIGHSEGTIIAPRIVTDQEENETNSTTTIKNIILMASVAQNVVDLLHFQMVENDLAYANQVLDRNHTGSFSIHEAIINDPLFGEPLAALFGSNATGNLDINKRLKPFLEGQYENVTSEDISAKCSFEGACPIWLNSHANLEPNLSIVGNIPNSTSVLILHGENDSQAPIQQSLLLEQRLTEVNHPDHSLITYPDLGHLFNPSSPWYTEFGPMEQYVLSDMHRWLSEHTRLERLRRRLVVFVRQLLKSSTN